MTAGYVKFKEKPDLQNIELFLRFLRVMEPDLPDSFRWSMTMVDKINKMNIAYEDALKQIPIWQMDHKETEKRGHGSTKEGIILALRYETFLNTVYSLCESIAKVTKGFYPKLPNGFREQRTKIIQKKREVDPKYATILESITWYDEVHSIRSEATHFLSGFTTISKEGEPGYFNKPKSERNDASQDISQENIEKHIQNIYQGVHKFLLDYGDHFIKKIDPDIRIPEICVLNDGGYCGAQAKSLNDYLLKKPGICHTPLYQCPIRNSCEAFKATPPMDKR